MSLYSRILRKLKVYRDDTESFAEAKAYSNAINLIEDEINRVHLRTMQLKEAAEKEKFQR